MEKGSIPFLSSYLDYFYILKVFLFLKNRSDRNPTFLKERTLLSRNHFTYLFMVVTILINFSPATLCLSPTLSLADPPNTALPSPGADTLWMLMQSALLVIVWSSYK